MNRFVITTGQIRGQEYRISALCDENRKLIEVTPEPVGAPSILGNIYVGRVENVVTNLNAAFIRIADGQKCYCSLADCRNPVFTKKYSRKKLAAGDELLVQVSKEAVKTKEPVVTTNLTFSGRYAVLTTERRQLSVSLRLSAAQREHYAGLLREKLGEEEDRGFGVIVRTNAEGASDEELLKEIAWLRQCYEQLLETAAHKTCGSCVYKERTPWQKMLLGLRREWLGEVVTDEREVFEEVCRMFDVPESRLTAGGSVPKRVDEVVLEDGLRLSYYADEMLSLSALYSLKGQLTDALREKVWLKSGAYLIIQPTEALTVIDVNTGKNVARKDVQENFLRVNLEAAAEIARQLRLRNISGIIVVDFMNLTSAEAQKTLMKEFGAALKQDSVPVRLVDMTKLGLVELTRKKVKKSLPELLAGQEKGDSKKWI